MKRFFLTFCTLCASVALWAAEVTIDGITLTYEVDTDDNVTIIDCPTDSLGDLKIPAEIDGKPVITIGPEAFADCGNIFSVVVPESVVTIGNKAFAGCTSMASIIIPVEGLLSIGDEAFAACSALTGIVIPKTVTTIGASAFKECVGLQSVTIPASVTTVGEQAFPETVVLVFEAPLSVDKWPEGYNKATTQVAIEIPDTTIAIESEAFMNCEKITSVLIPDGVVEIGENAFAGCSMLTAVTIPASVLNIGEGAFPLETILTFEGPLTVAKWPDGYNRGSQATVVIPTGLPWDRVDEDAFAGCTGLTAVTISEGVTSIDTRAFSGCTSLTSVKLPSTLTRIGASAFAGCTKLNSLTIPANVTDIGEGAFPMNTVLTFEGTLPLEKWRNDFNKASSASVLVPVPVSEDVTEIESGAFKDCTGLKTVTIAEGVTSIASEAFAGCVALTSVTVPTSVTSIGTDAFAGCTSLYRDENGIQYESSQKVVLIDVPTDYAGNAGAFALPNSVRFIHSNALAGCTALTEVTLPTSVTSIGAYAFNGCSALAEIIIPEGVTIIEDYAFAGCSALVSASLPSTVTTIGAYAFNGCAALTEIIIPEGITTIEEQTFAGCSALASVTLPTTVTTINARAFYGCENLPEIELPEGLLSMGEYVFASTGLNKIKLPANVETITEGAFSGCFYLFTVELPENGALTTIEAYAFSNCSGFETFTIPETVTTIAERAFYGCSRLKAVTISEGGLTSIGDYAFSGCTDLTSIAIPDSLIKLGNYAFFNCPNLHKDAKGIQYESREKVVLIDMPETLKGQFTIPKSVRFIHSNAFFGCSGLTAIVIPEGIVSIGNDAFAGCSGLTSIKIPAGLDVKAIGKNVFPSEVVLVFEDTLEVEAWPSDFNKNSKAAIKIPDGTTTIPSDAFAGCTGLTSVEIPKTVTSIGSRAFYDCSNLTSIKLPDGLTEIGSKAFYNCSNLATVVFSSTSQLTTIADNAFFGCSALTKITHPLNLTADSFLPAGLTSLGASAFSGCVGLTSLVIPEGVTQIKDGTFRGCTGLTTLTLPETVTAIGIRAFYGCSALAEMVIPDGVTFIGEYAFADCKGLTTLTIPDAVETIENSAFLNVAPTTLTAAKFPGQGMMKTKLTTLFVPAGTLIVPEFAFADCTALTSVTLPGPATGVNGTPSIAGLMAIGNRAFAGCTGLVKVTYPLNLTPENRLPDSVRTVAAEAFAGCLALPSVVIPDTVTTVGTGAFDNCPALYTAEDGVQYDSEEKRVLVAAPARLMGEFAVPESVRFIHSEAFSGCAGLTTVKFHTKVLNIGPKAFYNCADLRTIVFPENSELTTISTEAFAGCSELVEITSPLNLTGKNVLPAKVSRIGIKAFANCASLPEFTIPTSVSTISESTFAGCKELTAITIHGGVYAIGADAFASCGALKDVYITNLATWCSIGFSNAKSNPLFYAENFYVNDELVTDLVLPATTIAIRSYAFYNGTTFTSVTIPSTVGELGISAFTGCTNLALVKFLGVPPPDVGTFSVFPPTRGYYLNEPTIAPEWKKVIVDGKWKNLTMLELPTAILTDKALVDWLKPTIGTMTGAIVIDADTTLEDINDACLLGVNPEISDVLGDSAIAVKTTFDVSSITVENETIAIVVTVTVPVGSVPEDVTLNGEVKVWYKDNLVDEWSEEPIAVENPVVTTVEDDDTLYHISFNIPLDTHKFYQVTVE